MVGWKHTQQYADEIRTRRERKKRVKRGITSMATGFSMGRLVYSATRYETVDEKGNNTCSRRWKSVPMMVQPNISSSSKQFCKPHTKVRMFLTFEIDCTFSDERFEVLIYLLKSRVPLLCWCFLSFTTAYNHYGWWEKQEADGA